MWGQEIRLIDYIQLKLSVTQEIYYRPSRWRLSLRRLPERTHGVLWNQGQTIRRDLQRSDIKTERHSFSLPVFIYPLALLPGYAVVNNIGKRAPLSGSFYSYGRRQIMVNKYIEF